MSVDGLFHLSPEMFHRVQGVVGSNPSSDMPFRGFPPPLRAAAAQIDPPPGLAILLRNLPVPPTDKCPHAMLSRRLTAEMLPAW